MVRQGHYIVVREAKELTVRELGPKRLGNDAKISGEQCPIIF